MDIAYINEDMNEGESFFRTVDVRSSFYDDNDYTPTSCINELIWSDSDISDLEALDLIKCGAFNVTRPIAELTKYYINLLTTLSLIIIDMLESTSTQCINDGALISLNAPSIIYL